MKLTGTIRSLSRPAWARAVVGVESAWRNAEIAVRRGVVVSLEISQTAAGVALLVAEVAYGTPRGRSYSDQNAEDLKHENQVAK